MGDIAFDAPPSLTVRLAIGLTFIEVGAGPWLVPLPLNRDDVECRV